MAAIATTAAAPLLRKYLPLSIESTTKRREREKERERKIVG